MPVTNNLNSFLNQLPNLLISLSYLQSRKSDQELDQREFIAGQKQQAFQNQFAIRQRNEGLEQQEVKNRQTDLGLKLNLLRGLSREGDLPSERKSIAGAIFGETEGFSDIDQALQAGVNREDTFNISMQSENLGTINQLLTTRLSKGQRTRAETKRGLLLESAASKSSVASIEHLVGHPTLGARADAIIANPASAARLAPALLADESRIDPEDAILLAEIQEETRRENAAILAGEAEAGKAVGESRLDEFTRGLTEELLRVGRAVKGPLDVFEKKLEASAIKGAATRKKISEQVSDALGFGIEKFADELSIDTTSIAGIDSSIIEVIQAGGEIEDPEKLLNQLNFLKKTNRRR